MWSWISLIHWGSNISFTPRVTICWNVIMGRTCCWPQFLFFLCWVCMLSPVCVGPLLVLWLPLSFDVRMWVCVVIVFKCQPFKCQPCNKLATCPGCTPASRPMSAGTASSPKWWHMMDIIYILTIVADGFLRWLSLYVYQIMNNVSLDVLFGELTVPWINTGESVLWLDATTNEEMKINVSCVSFTLRVNQWPYMTQILRVTIHVFQIQERSRRMSLV